MMTEDLNPYVCYLLMRNDLPDYLSGKSMAQAHHNGTLFMYQMRKVVEEKPIWLVPFEGWLAQGKGFGTTIVLSVNYPQLREKAIGTFADVLCGIVHDPSYPVRDGDMINHMPVDTCGYVFGRRSATFPTLGDLPLFKEPKSD